MATKSVKPLKKCTLIAQQSPKKAFYRIQLELDDNLNVVVVKESGITTPVHRVCDRRSWGFEKDFAKALKFYDRKVREKLRGGRGRVYVQARVAEPSGPSGTGYAGAVARPEITNFLAARVTAV